MYAQGGIVRKLKFSIVIPAFNYASTLPRAVESALQQPGDDYEVVVVDDGSTDNTKNIATPYAEKYIDKFRYIYQENRGPAGARNTGIDSTSGEYLLFLDADDELIENVLSHIRDYLNNHKMADLIVGAHITVDENGVEKIHHVKPIPTNPEKQFLFYLDKKISMANGSIVMHRRIFDRIRYSETIRQAEDLPVFGQIFALYRCQSMDIPVAKIYKHSDSRRYDIESARLMGLRVVDALFDPNIMPARFMRYRNRFYIGRCLSLFRRFYKAGKKKEAKRLYHQALKSNPIITLKWRYLSKYLRIISYRLPHCQWHHWSNNANSKTDIGNKEKS